MKRLPIKNYLNEIFKSFEYKKFSINSLAKFLFPYVWENDKKKAQIIAADIVRAGVSSHYQIIKYPIKIVNGTGSVNKLTSDNLLTYKNHVIFSIKNVLDSNKIDKSIFNFFKNNKGEHYSLQDVSTHLEYSEVLIRKVLNRLVILGELSTEQLKGNQNVYFIKKAEESPVLIKSKKNRSRGELFRDLYVKIGTDSFSVQGAASILFPEDFNCFNKRKETVEKVTKLIVKAVKSFQLFDYRDAKVSLKYGGITNISNIKLKNIVNHPVFVFKNCNKSVWDMTILRAIQNAPLSKDGYTKKELYSMFSKKGTTTVDRSLLRLLVTGKLEQTNNREYRVSDGRKKTTLSDHNVKVDQSLVFVFQTIMSNIVTNFKVVSDHFREHDATAAQILEVLINTHISEGKVKYLNTQGFKKLLTKYDFFVDEQLNYFLTKAESYGVFRLIEDSKILKNKQYSINYNNMYRVLDSKFLEEVDLQEGHNYSLSHIDTRLAESSNNKFFKNVPHIYIRLRVAGILEELESTKNKVVKLYTYKPIKKEVKQVNKGSRKVPVILTVDAEYAVEDSYEDSLDDNLPEDTWDKSIDDAKEKLNKRLKGVKPFIRKKRKKEELPINIKIENGEKLKDEHAVGGKRNTIKREMPVFKICIGVPLKKLYDSDAWGRSTTLELANELLINKPPYSKNILEGMLTYLITEGLITEDAGFYSVSLARHYDSDQKLLSKLYDHYNNEEFNYENAIATLDLVDNISPFIRLSIDERLISRQGAYYSVNPKEFSMFGNNVESVETNIEPESPQLYSKEIAQKLTESYVCPPAVPQSLPIITSGIQIYHLDKSNDKEVLTQKDLLHRFRITDAREGVNHNPLLKLISKLCDFSVDTDAVYIIFELDFSQPHNFVKDIVGDNKSWGFLLTDDKDEFTDSILIVPEVIPFFSK